MRTESDAKGDYASRIKSAWRVAKVSALKNFRLEVTFVDGLNGYVDLSNYITSKQAGVFRQLQDESLFNQVCLKYGVVTWPGDLDLAPDAMYDVIKEKGEWIIEC